MARVPLVLSVVALVVALLGSTPLGEAAGNVVGFAKRAGTADVAKDAKRLNGRVSSTTPGPGMIPVVGPDGLLPASLGATGPKGERGEMGEKGEKGGKGDRGPAGLVRAYTQLVDDGVFKALPNGSPTALASLTLPAGRWLVLGRVQVAWAPQGGSFNTGCQLVPVGQPAIDRWIVAGGAGETTGAVLIGLQELKTTTKIELRCTGNALAPSRWSNARVSAVQVTDALRQAPSGANAPIGSVGPVSGG